MWKLAELESKCDITILICYMLFQRPLIIRLCFLFVSIYLAVFIFKLLNFHYFLPSTLHFEALACLLIHSP